MVEKDDKFAVLIGDSSLAQSMRRELLRRGTTWLAATQRLHGVRRSLVLGPETQVHEPADPAVVVCVDLAQTTLDRYGNALPALLDDVRSFGSRVYSLGLLPEAGLNDRAASLGCDVYANADQAGELLDALTDSSAIAGAVNPRSLITPTQGPPAAARPMGRVPEEWFFLYPDPRSTGDRWTDPGQDRLDLGGRL